MLGIGLGLTSLAALRRGGAAGSSPALLGVHVEPQLVDLQEFEAWLGKPVVMIGGFVGYASDVDYTAWWLVDRFETVATPGAASASRQMHFTVPLVYTGGPTLAEVAAGGADLATMQAAWATLADEIAGQWPGAETEVIVRPGHEFNLTGTYPWATVSFTDYITVFRAFVDTFRDDPNSGAFFKFEWCPNIGDGGAAEDQPDVEAYYPGDTYVDFIGCDFYYFSAFADPDGATEFASQRDRDFGLQWQVDFAAAHDKQLAASEWGCDTEGMGDWIDAVAEWFAANPYAYQMYFNRGTKKLSDWDLPATGAAYIAQFGNTEEAPSTVPPLGNSWVVDGEGNYVKDGSGNFVYAPSTPTAVTITWLSGFTDGNIPEDTAVVTNLATLSTTDADLPNDAHTYSLLVNEDSKLQISGINLQLAASLDYETETEFDFTVRTTDAEDLTFDQADTITVTDVAEYEDETDALLAAMSVQPDATRAGHIDTLIIDLKTAGVWTKMRRLYVPVAHDEQAGRLDWKNPGTGTLATVNAPIFTTDRGFSGNGTTSYLTSNFIPSTDGGNYLQNDNHAAVWIGTEVNNSGQVDFGNANSSICSRSGTSTAATRNSSTAADNVAIPDSTSVGWLCCARNNSANYEVQKNAAAPVTVTRTSAALTANPFYLLCRNNGGTSAVGFSTRRLQAAHWGAYLTEAERDATHAAFSAYMTAIGAA